MAEKSFDKAADLASYAEDLRIFHQPRDRRLMSLQAMWQTTLRATPNGRTIYKSNEPWKATRLSVSLLSGGRSQWRVTLPPDDATLEGKEERDAAEAMVLLLMKCSFYENDQRRLEQGLSTFDRGWTYLASIYGWTAGIALVEDGKGEDFPVLVDLWNPLDTYPDMKRGRDTVVHYTRMTYADILETFGPKRKGGKIKGYDFTFDKESVPDPEDEFTVVEAFGRETHTAVALAGGEAKMLKEQMPHKLGCNPAWWMALDAPPIHHTVTSEKDGTVLKTGRPDVTSTRWLETYGQSPMLGYEIAYRVKSERMNQVGDVMERWSNPKVIAKTPDGKLVKIDLSNPDSIANVPAGTQLEILTPNTFPVDTRAYLDVLDEDVETASYSKAAYGALSSSDAATALQMARQGGGYIVGPMKEQLQAVKALIGNKILTQLGAGKRGRAYKAPIAVRTTNKRNQPVWEYIDLSAIPRGARVTCELRGAGMQPDKLQSIAVANQVANAANPIYDIETLHDEILQSDNPPEIAAKLFWQRMTSSRKVDEYMAPITTMLFWADKLRAQGTQRGVEIADAAEGMATAAMDELRANIVVTQAKSRGAVTQAAQEALMGPTPGGMGEQQGGMQGQDMAALAGAQQEGVAPMGAPVAGVQQAPTGPAPERGAQMVQAALGG